MTTTAPAGACDVPLTRCDPLVVLTRSATVVPSTGSKASSGWAKTCAPTASGGTGALKVPSGRTVVTPTGTPLTKTRMVELAAADVLPLTDVAFSVIGSTDAQACAPADCVVHSVGAAVGSGPSVAAASAPVVDASSGPDVSSPATVVASGAHHAPVIVVSPSAGGAIVTAAGSWASSIRVAVITSGGTLTPGLTPERIHVWLGRTVVAPTAVRLT
mmetsp:Transcript_32381/g.74137  ORF Transcript_32381/g.74137 Transcript_32381/m.74137 type:complete len:216 (-) Transcript_32381:60-707(-)